MREWPSFEDSMVAAYPIEIIGLQGEAGFDAQVQASVVAKAEDDSVIVVRGDELHPSQDFACDFRKMNDLIGVGAMGGLRPVDIAFSFSYSHIFCLRRRYG
jgi:hypothetical protein